MSGDFQAEIRLLGIESSPAFVRQPEGNGVAERFIRPLKENFCGCTPSTPSRTCGARCGTSRPTTTPLGSSPGTDIALPTRSAPTSDGLLNPTRPTYPWLPERRS